jgi:hypothetical protein
MSATLIITGIARKVMVNEIERESSTSNMYLGLH